MILYYMYMNNFYPPWRLGVQVNSYVNVINGKNFKVGNVTVSNEFYDHWYNQTLKYGHILIYQVMWMNESVCLQSMKSVHKSQSLIFYIFFFNVQAGVVASTNILTHIDLSNNVDEWKCLLCKGWVDEKTDSNWCRCLRSLIFC